MKRALTPVILGSFFISACGGSGGGGITPPGGNPGVPGTGTAITSANAATVSNVAWQAANSSAGLVGVVGAAGIAGNPGGVNKAQLETSKSAVTRLAENAMSIPITQDCLVTGTLTIDSIIADPFTPTLTAGDTIDVSANNCSDDGVETLNGDLAMVVDAFSGDFLGGIYSLTMSMTLTNFAVTNAADTLTSNGDATVTIDTSAAPFVSASINGNSMTTVSNASTEALSAFQTTQTVDGGLQTQPFTLASSGVLDSSLLTGSVTYTTPVVFQGEGFGFPGSGEFLVEGDNSSARLVVIDDVNVRIDIDNDGDSVVDEMINMTWQELVDS